MLIFELNVLWTKIALGFALFALVRKVQCTCRTFYTFNTSEDDREKVAISNFETLKFHKNLLPGDIQQDCKDLLFL